MSILLIFIILLIVAGLLPMTIKRFFVKNKERNSLVAKIINGLTILSSCLLLSSIIMAYFNYYFIGYKTTTFILIITAFLFIISYLMSNYKNKIYLRMVEFLLFISIFVTVLIATINLIGFSENKIYEDSNYRIESFRFMNSNAEYLPDLYVKNGLLERKLKLRYQENYEYDFIHSIHMEKVNDYLIKQKDSLIEVVFQFEDGYELVTEAWPNSCDL